MLTFNPHDVSADIIFNDDQNVGPEIHSYTTYDDISGRVNFRSLSAATTKFNYVEIALMGFTKTYKHDHLAPQGAAIHSHASHVFLRLFMPIPRSAYSGDFTLNTQQTRSFPFHFVVPAHLLPTSCNHPVGGEHVQEAHFNLPPSMGGSLLPFDDFAPQMGKITYAVTAKMSATDGEIGQTKTIAESQRKMHIVPAISESPPTHVSSNNEKWVLSKTKLLKRGIFKGKLGTVTVSTSQPRAVILNPSSRHQPSTMVDVKFRFYPADASTKPPRLGAIGSKLKCMTFSSVKPVAEIPDDHITAAPLDRFSGSYNSTINLTHRCVENVKWEWHLPAPGYVRRDSGYSTSTLGDPPSDHFDPPQDSSEGWYEANVPTPITLPRGKTWLPTFHSCLISRFYTLILETSVHTPSTTMPQTNITLRCPIQIASVPREGRHREFVENAPTGDMVPPFVDAVGRRRVERDVEVRSEARRLLEIEQEVNEQLPRDVRAAGTASERVQAPPGYE